MRTQMDKLSTPAQSDAQRFRASLNLESTSAVFFWMVIYAITINTFLDGKLLWGLVYAGMLIALVRMLVGPKGLQIVDPIKDATLDKFLYIIALQGVLFSVSAALLGAGRYLSALP